MAFLDKGLENVKRDPAEFDNAFKNIIASFEYKILSTKDSYQRLAKDPLNIKDYHLKKINETLKEEEKIIGERKKAFAKQKLMMQIEEAKQLIEKHNKKVEEMDKSKKAEEIEKSKKVEPLPKEKDKWDEIMETIHDWTPEWFR